MLLKINTYICHCIFSKSGGRSTICRVDSPLHRPKLLRGYLLFLKRGLFLVVDHAIIFTGRYIPRILMLKQYKIDVYIEVNAWQFLQEYPNSLVLASNIKKVLPYFIGTEFGWGTIKFVK